MALVISGAYRTFKYLTESTYYAYAMLVRVKDGVITYGCDMLDREAADYWVRSRRHEKWLSEVTPPPTIRCKGSEARFRLTAGRQFARSTATLDGGRCSPRRT
jgi:hypothetical protein